MGSSFRTQNWVSGLMTSTLANREGLGLRLGGGQGLVLPLLEVLPAPSSSLSQPYSQAWGRDCGKVLQFCGSELSNQAVNIQANYFVEYVCRINVYKNNSNTR